MSDKREGQSAETGLNPALKTRTDKTHDTTTSTPPPAESASVQRQEGRGWPMIWLVVTILCAVLALWILFF